MGPVGIILIIMVLILFIGICIYCVIDSKNKEEQKQLMIKIFDRLGTSFEEMDFIFADYNKWIVVKSRQTLEKYREETYFKENRREFLNVKKTIVRKQDIINNIDDLINRDNPFKNEKWYAYAVDELKNYKNKMPVYVVLVKYITSAGNCLDEKSLIMSLSSVTRIENTPELYMTKAEMKEIEKERLENKKKDLYHKVNSIIDMANVLKDEIIIKNDIDKLDDAVAKLFDRTVNSIQKIKSTSSDEWGLIENVIDSIEREIKKLDSKNRKLKMYYASEKFAKIKNTCELLIQSQKDFNLYIEEKIESISKMFGTRPTRNETEHEDTYNYIRSYKKTISPFTAELSSTVFSSAENNPMNYILKCFYPNRSMYKEQIANLKTLLSEIETLKEAKEIIDNYKKDYADYIKDVPPYVMEEDEDGFYSRLGFATISENILSVEYKFVYTSDGGMAQRSFTVPMNEETITELIIQMENKLSLSALAKEQRAMMTPKLRFSIKERDNFTCKICGNSTYNENNLLLEVDHIIPIARGGLTIEDNLQTLCWKCNRSKGAKID